MANGTELEQRIGKGEVIILDGAVGTPLRESLPASIPMP